MPYRDGKKTGNEACRKQLEGMDAWSFKIMCPDEKRREEILDNVQEMEWEHSSFGDPGDDWNKLHLKISDTETVVLRQNGY